MLTTDNTVGENPISEKEAAPTKANALENVVDKVSQNDDPYNDDPENTGLPRLVLGAKPVSVFEFWPSWVFYVPVAAYWLYLGLRYRNFALPLAVNPNIPLGGMLEESKLEILESAGALASSHILPFAAFHQSETLTRDATHQEWELFAQAILERASHVGLALPLVVKPEYGCRGTGVQRVRNLHEFVKYLRGFPPGKRFILQTLAPYGAEAGVFYERFPGSEHGKVTSITLKYRPYVIGDGKSTLKSLILKNPRASILRKRYFAINEQSLNAVPQKGEVVALSFAGSHCKGSIFKNGNAFITDALSQKIDEVMQDFPEFYYGRLDIKFKDIRSFKEGREFVIIEVNGVSSEKTHIWDASTSLKEAFATLFEQYRTLYQMGNALRKQGKQAPSIKRLIRAWINMLRDKTEYPETR